MADIKPLDETPPETQPLPTPYRSVPYSPEGFGAGIGSAVQQAASVLGEHARDEKRKADSVAIEGAYSRAQGALNDIILNPKTGYAGLKGADAAGAPGGDGGAPPVDKYLEKFNKALADVDGSLANDDQRREMGWRLARLRESGVHAALTHARQQADVVGAAVHAGGQDLAVQHVAIIAASPGATADDLQQPLADIVENARLRAQGVYGKNATPQMVQAVALPDLQRAAVTAMAAGLNAPGTTPARAQQLFGVYGEYLGSHRGTIERAMANLQTDDQAAQEGSKLIAQATDKVTGWVDPNKANALLAGVPETPFKGDLTAYVEKRLGQSEKFRHDLTDRHVGDVYSQAADNDGSLDISQVKPITKAWMQTYAPEKWADLKRKAAADADRAQKSEDRAALPEERDNFITAGWMMATQPEKFATMTPPQFQATFRDKLAPKDYRTLGTLWREQLQAANKEQAHLPPVVLETALSVGRAAGVFPGGNQDPKKWSSADSKAAWESLTEALIKESDQFRRVNGAPAKVEDLQKMAVNHLVGVKLKGAGLFGTDKTTTALQAEQDNGGVLPSGAEIVSVPGVPSAEVERIKGVLAGAGKAVSGASILTVYQRQQARKAAGQ